MCTVIAAYVTLQSVSKLHSKILKLQGENSRATADPRSCHPDPV